MDNTLTSETFLERLRTKTADSHTKLEELPVSKSIMKPNVTQQEYINYLQLMHDVIKDAERNVFPSLSHIVADDLIDKNRTERLEKDLQLLGQPKTDCKTVFENASGYSNAFALGILYVLEGSTLGGRVIYKNINTALGLDADSGLFYFAGYGGQTGSHWRTFLETVIKYESDNNAEEEITAGAEFAYKTIAKHFTV